ncbi:hypothetical protein NOCA240057 [metagenome]|uniref:Uncharacterized protein n=1 Tax=metagenome TaxID=256318 RepID=A0A2P2C5Q6_9ZZZZ
MSKSEALQLADALRNLVARL